MLIGSAFLMLTFYLSLRVRRRFEQALPVATLATMLALTALAMAGRLPWVDALAVGVIALVAVLSAVRVVRRRSQDGD